MRGKVILNVLPVFVDFPVQTGGICGAEAAVWLFSTTDSSEDKNTPNWLSKTKQHKTF